MGLCLVLSMLNSRGEKEGTKTDVQLPGPGTSYRAMARGI